MTATLPRVFVTDAQWNKSVAAIRSLGARGVPVTAGEATCLAAGLFSRYVSRRLVYPSPMTTPARFLSALVRELAGGEYGLVLPMELSTLLFLSRHRQAILPHARFPFAPHEVLSRAARKWPVAQAAVRLGIPVPSTRFLSRTDLVRDLAEDLIRDPGLPLVLKADLSEGGRGLFYCRTPDELQTALQAVGRARVDYVAQAMLPPGGDALGVSMFLGEAGEVLALAGHRRLRQYPLGGGPSTCRQSFLDPTAAEYAVRLLRGLGFTGLAMVEFRTDPRDGQPHVLEVNPKFWGSLPLAIASGVDFPSLVYAQALGLPLPECRQEPGVVVRNLIPGDLLHFFAARGRVGCDFWNPCIRDDLLSLHDPGPVLGRVLSALACLTDPKLRSMLASHRGIR
jgi:predicted ATP-grasp superfamily ATP-dependent carboligase